MVHEYFSIVKLCNICFLPAGEGRYRVEEGRVSFWRQEVSCQSLTWSGCRFITYCEQSRLIYRQGFSPSLIPNLRKRLVPLASCSNLWEVVDGVCHTYSRVSQEVTIAAISCASLAELALRGFILIPGRCCCLHVWV